MVCLSFFIFSCRKDLPQLPSEGMSPSGLIARSFSPLRVRWTIKEGAEKAKTRSIGVRQYPRRLCFAGASKGIDFARIGSRSRLPYRSVLLCFAQRCPPDTRTLLPNQQCKPIWISAQKSPKPQRFRTFSIQIFAVEIYRYPTQKTAFEEDLN